ARPKPRGDRASNARNPRACQRRYTSRGSLTGAWDLASGAVHPWIGVRRNTRDRKRRVFEQRECKPAASSILFEPASKDLQNGLRKRIFTQDQWIGSNQCQRSWQAYWQV